MEFRPRRSVGWLLALGLCLWGTGPIMETVGHAAALQGKFEKIDAPSTHTPGKVKVTEFADFFCPHCHMFERTAIPMLEQEFGDRVAVEMVGYPVIPGMLPTPFIMYEQAKLMGKGPEMKAALFLTIHRDRVILFDRTLRGLLAKQVGLDPVAFEAGLASGLPATAFSEGRRWGERIEIKSTPTVLLDGNIKIEGEYLTPENLKKVIHSILDADPTG